MIMTSASRLSALLLFFLAAGCTTYIISDYFVRFHITGSILYQSGEAGKGIEVLFEDTGMDHWAGNQGKLLHVGWFNEEGWISANFHYNWGTRPGRKRSIQPMDGTFKLVLVKDGVTLEDISFRLSDLERQQGTYYVTFEASLHP